MHIFAVKSCTPYNETIVLLNAVTLFPFFKHNLTKIMTRISNDIPR